MAAPSLQQMSQALTSTGLPAPSPSFLTPILNPQNQNARPPLPALIATAKHRLLSSNLASTPPILDPTKNHAFPTTITDVSVKAVILTADVPVQVLDIEDLSKSKWEQIEALEAERKGETTKGREVIRVVPPDPDDIAASTAYTEAPNSTNNAANTPKSSFGPFKLLLQDMKGQKAYGFELKKVDKVGYPPTMSIGSKMMLRKGCKVARGMVLLEPATVAVLGGKIEGLDKEWREGREARLREAVGDRRDEATER